MKSKQVTIPTELADLTIKDYKHLEFIGRIENPQTRALKQVAYLTGLEESEVEQMSRESFTGICKYIQGLDTTDINYPLQPIVQVNGVEYGFEPDLNRMGVGAFADLDTYSQDATKQLDTICSILYRPITNKRGKEYTIEPYTGSNADAMSDLPMDAALGALTFFLRLKAALLRTSLNSSKAGEVARWGKSGVGTQASTT